MFSTRAEERRASEMREKISTLERESTDLGKLNQEQAAAFMHENKELELLNKQLTWEVETLRLSSASLEEQVSFCVQLQRLGSIHLYDDSCSPQVRGVEDLLACTDVRCRDLDAQRLMLSQVVARYEASHEVLEHQVSDG